MVGRLGCVAIAEHGLSLISAPAAADAAHRPTRFEVPVTVAAPATLEAGGTGELTATFEVDLASFAAEVLEERVRPTVEVGYGPALAQSAWVEMQVADLVARLDVSDSVTPSGAPVVTSTGATPDAAFTGTALELAFPALTADSRAADAPFEVNVTWPVVAADDATGDATVAPGALTFDLTLDIGVMLSGTPLTGGIDASLRCDSASEPLATITIVAPPDEPDPDRWPQAWSRPPPASDRPAQGPWHPAQALRAQASAQLSTRSASDARL